MKAIVAACLFSLALAGVAHSGPTITLSWDGGPGTHPQNRSRLAGTPATAVVTATGFDQPVRAIQVRIWVRSQLDGVPDSWRYEPGGCAEGGFHAPEVAVDATCPFLTGPNPMRLTDVQYTLGREQFVYVLFHDPVTTLPGTRYTIAQFQFDHSADFDGLGLKPDSCGCLEQPQAVFLQFASWLDADGVERAFSVTDQCLAWEDPANSVDCPFFGCDLCEPEPPPPPHNPCADQQPTAATQRTWGAVKALYR